MPVRSRFDTVEDSSRAKTVRWVLRGFLVAVWCALALVALRAIGVRPFAKEEPPQPTFADTARVDFPTWYVMRRFGVVRIRPNPRFVVLIHPSSSPRALDPFRADVKASVGNMKAAFHPLNPALIVRTDTTDPALKRFLVRNPTVRVHPMFGDSAKGFYFETGQIKVMVDGYRVNDARAKQIADSTGFVIEPRFMKRYTNGMVQYIFRDPRWPEGDMLVRSRAPYRFPEVLDSQPEWGMLGGEAEVR